MRPFPARVAFPGAHSCLRHRIGGSGSFAKASEQPFTMFDLKREEGIGDDKWWSYFAPSMAGFAG